MFGCYNICCMCVFTGFVHCIERQNYAQVTEIIRARRTFEILMRLQMTFFGLNVSKMFVIVFVAVLSRVIIVCSILNEHIFIWPKYQFRSNLNARWFAGHIHIHTYSLTASWHTCHIINFRPTVFISLHHTTQTHTHTWKYLNVRSFGTNLGFGKRNTQSSFWLSFSANSEVLLYVIIEIGLA